MLTLLLFCAFIGFISIIAGWVPLYTPQVLRTAEVSQVASGIILGTAFIIVIPEGYEQASESGYANLAGAAAILGFLLMLTVSRCSNGDPLSSDQGIFSLSRGVPRDIELSSPRTWPKDISLTTFGLTIHTAADGVALAAASAVTFNAKLQVLVFLSVLLHKTPAAFSLTTLLFKEHEDSKYSLSQIKRDILLFSLTGPVVAVLLALPLFLLGIENVPNLFTGICLGFSGGTFMYVSAHILESAQSNKSGFKDIKLIGAGTLVAVIASFVPE